MDSSLSDLPGRAKSDQSIEFSPSSKEVEGFSRGELVVAKVQSDRAEGKRKLQVSNGEQSFTHKISGSDSMPPPGSVVIGRIQSIQNQFRLSVISSEDQVEQIKHDELMNLIESIDGSSVGESSGNSKPSEARSQLMNSKISYQEGSQTSTNLPDPRDLINEMQDDSIKGKKQSLRGIKLTTQTDLRSKFSLENDQNITVEVAKNSKNGRVTLRHGANEFSVKTPVNLKEGMNLQVQVGEYGKGTSLQLIEVKNSSSYQPLSRELRNIGLGAELRLTDTPEQDFSLREGETFSMDVLEDKNQGKVQLEAKGKTVTAWTNVPLRAGSKLTAKVTGTGEEPQVEIQSVSRDASKLSNQKISTLLQQIGLPDDQLSIESMKIFLSEHSNENPETVTGKLEERFEEAQISNSDKIRKIISDMLNSIIRPDNQQSDVFQALNDLSRPKLKELINELGFQPDRQTINNAQSILETDPNPSKSNLQKALQNVNLLLDDDGGLQKKKVRALLFLTKNNLPVNKNSIEQLSASFAKSSSANSDNSDLQSALPKLSGNSPSAENVKNKVQKMGFDFIRQLSKGISKGKQTVQADLLSILGGSETESAQVQGETIDGKGLKKSANNMMSAMVKNSLASVVEEGQMYFFVPFQEDEETRLMKLRFRDERDSEEELKDEKWKVTIDVELSELGSMRIQAQRDMELISVNFRSENAKSRTLIRDSKSILKESLEERGFEVHVNTGPLENQKYSMIDWDLFYGAEDIPGNVDITI